MPTQDDLICELLDLRRRVGQCCSERVAVGNLLGIDSDDAAGSIRATATVVASRSGSSCCAAGSCAVARYSVKIATDKGNLRMLPIPASSGPLPLHGVSFDLPPPSCAAIRVAIPVRYGTVAVDARLRATLPSGTVYLGIVGTVLGSDDGQFAVLLAPAYDSIDFSPAELALVTLKGEPLQELRLAVSVEYNPKHPHF